ncbi:MULTISPECIES: cytochrome c oxidase assembly protein [unclassified Agarivorans]|uniref:cytochrome c oxidase assembly protein n=1 Tax=unclassified Agarivorans TaxID=2636026 RepID=UPI0026E24A89|nr:MULTISPECIES: cytochrome c oxidase assembly protein [unclassified Agarivorans]MDO6687571.1 cytochrome c oxidase assembly protein [Agarivorans sp. 3_MG-2023]MDO6717096.1 cytochrome c oxidase assembly protein [Agarivorans sp. 2_MG-2023]
MLGHRRLVVRLLLVVVAMFGFGYALVPLYDVFCKVTGINGKTAKTASEVSMATDEQRIVTVEFISYVPQGLNWKFGPKVNRVKVHPGETLQVNFSASNFTARRGTVQAVPSVSPGLAANHLKKVSCFCFEQQTLAPGEQQDMPLFFYVAPELPEDINTLTLAYTLFAVEGAELNESETAQTRADGEVSNDAAL